MIKYSSDTSVRMVFNTNIVTICEGMIQFSSLWSGKGSHFVLDEIRRRADAPLTLFQNNSKQVAGKEMNYNTGVRLFTLT